MKAAGRWLALPLSISVAACAGSPAASDVDGGGGGSRPGTASAERPGDSGLQEREAGDGSWQQAYGPPTPVNVEVTLSSSTITTTVSSEHGGFVSLIGPDGSQYQLEVPPRAVLSDVDVTMTVLEEVTGSPLGDDFEAGVQLLPGGLRFLEPAILTITPARAVPVEAEGPFAADSDGADFHLHPLLPDGPATRMAVMHFSLFGLFQTDEERRAEMIRKTAADVEAQLAQELQALIQAERQRLLLGAEGNPSELGEALPSAARYYIERILRQLTALAEADHTLFAEAVSKVLGLDRQLQLLGAAGGFEKDFAELYASLSRGFANYVEVTADRCLEHDLGAITDLLGFERVNQLLGGGLFTNVPGGIWEMVRGCARFELHMESTMEFGGSMCGLIGFGLGEGAGGRQSSEVRTVVPIEALGSSEIHEAPIEWVDASYEMECAIDLGGAEPLPCSIHFAGLADPGQFGVLAVNLELNIVEHEKPGPDGGETEVTRLLHNILVRPGDPQIKTAGGCDIGGEATETSSSGWLSGWKDHHGEERINWQGDEAWLLQNWEQTPEGEEIARKEYSESISTPFGTATEETVFVLRHTPIDTTP